MNSRASFAVWFALAFVSVTAAQERVALVVGNGTYEGNPLANPVNDAAAIAEALQSLGFQVTKKTDVDLAQLEDAVVAFRRSLKRNSVALFFYAGHGLQVKGENFLLPIKANLKAEFQVTRKCYEVGQVLAAMDESEAALKILILDCCRDNPFTRSWTRTSGKQGLAAINDIPSGTIVAFSTSPGQTALDGAKGGSNSPYTQQLVASLRSRPANGLEVIAALRKASQEVKRATGQVPWLNLDASLDDFYLWREVDPWAGRGGLKRVPHPTLSGVATYENPLGMKFVEVPAGEFEMGAGAAYEGVSAKSERPAHRVQIGEPFLLGMHEVTKGDFLKFYHAAKYTPDAVKNGKGGRGYTGDDSGPTTHLAQRPEFVPWNSGFPQGNDHPVVNVTWNDAQAFCTWLSEKEGVRYRLPTEAEWEYACRAGTKTQYWSGDDPESLAGIANVLDASAKTRFPFPAIQANDGFVFTAPVGSFRCNAFGLYDMHGNVEEWCQDLYDPNYYATLSEVSRDPAGPNGEQKARVRRGGAWYFGASAARCSNRNWAVPTVCQHLLGFRVVISKSR